MEVNKIYNENCLETMARMPDDFIDLTITSPPYDNLRAYRNDVDKTWGRDTWEPVFKALYRVTKPGGVVVWVVGDATINGSETGTSFRQALWALDCGFKLHDTMVYQKDNPPPVGGPKRYYQHFEYMFVFSKGSPKTFNPIKAPRRNKHNDKRTERVKGFTRNKQGVFVKKRVKLNRVVKIGNIWKYVVGGGNSVKVGIQHPAAFPSQLVLDHIHSWSNEGDLIYDPFMGSGTTKRAAVQTKRQYLGSEISKEYCELMEN